MPYDKSFYDMYKTYLQEKAVRANHDLMFQQWKWHVRTPLYVVDMGCGIGEYDLYGNSVHYVGIDTVNSGKVPNFVLADYTDPAKLAIALTRLDPQPNAFVSLFSSECCNSAKRKYEIYEGIFEAFPSIQHGLVSGFFYLSKRNKETVKEKGGIKSFQTIEPVPQSRAFAESRLTIHTPSQMFGPDVIEVWKFFTRREAAPAASYDQLQGLFRLAGTRE